MKASLHDYVVVQMVESFQLSFQRWDFPGHCGDVDQTVGLVWRQRCVAVGMKLMMFASAVAWHNEEKVIKWALDHPYSSDPDRLFVVHNVINISLTVSVILSVML